MREVGDFFLMELYIKSANDRIMTSVSWTMSERPSETQRGNDALCVWTLRLPADKH